MAKSYAGWPYNVCQLGRESTAGTAVAATSIWRGAFGGFKDERKREVAEEDVGILVNTQRTYDTMYGASVTIPDTPLTFEQILHLLEASIGTVSPTGAGPYVYAYAPSLTDTPNTIKTYTLRIGNKVATADQRIIPYGTLKELKLSGKQGEAWMMGGSWQGNRVTTGSLTAALSLAAVEEAIFAKTSLYIDATGGTIGTTQKSGVLMGFELTYNPAIEYVPVGDGNLYSVAHKIGRATVGFRMTLELEQDTGVSTVNAERTFYESNTLRLIQVSIAGSSSRTLVIKLAAKYDSVSEPEKQGEHNTTVTFEGHCDYSSADSLFFSVTVTNNLASVP